MLPEAEEDELLAKNPALAPVPWPAEAVLLKVLTPLAEPVADTPLPEEVVDGL